MKEKQNYWYDADQIEQIAIRIKKRDDSAWLEFMEITKQRYYCIALDALNHNEELANEALIEAYTKIFKKIDSLKENRALAVYGEKTVAHATCDILKKEGKYIVMSELDNKDMAESFENSIENDVEEYCPKEQFDKLARKTEIREGLQKIIETLPTKQRMALTLYYLGDEKQTYHEIGKVLGINEETARSQVRYAKNKIKTKIEELRAQGKSFYTVAPLPFLAWMLNDELNKVKVPDTLIESVKAATISPIATPPKKLPVEATKSVVTNKVATSSASAVAKAGLSKVAIGALTAVVGIGAFAGSYAVISKKNPDSYIDYEKAYQPIIQQYKDVLSKEEIEDENDYSSTLCMMVYEDHPSLNYGYSYVDVNNDGVTELLVGAYDNKSKTSKSFLDMYTIKDGLATPCKSDIYGQDETEVHGNMDLQYYLANNGDIISKEPSQKNIDEFANGKLSYDEMSADCDQIGIFEYNGEKLHNKDYASDSNQYPSSNLKTIQYVPFFTSEKKSKTTATNNHQEYDVILKQYYDTASTQACSSTFDPIHPSRICDYLPYAEDPLSDIGFAFMDLNDDGQDELLIGIMTSERSFCDVYTIKENVPHIVDLKDSFGTNPASFWYRIWFSLTSDNKIYHFGSSGAKTYYASLGHMEGSTIITDKEYYYDGMEDTTIAQKYNSSTQSFEDCDENEIKNFKSKYEDEENLKKISYTPLSEFKASSRLYNKKNHTQELEGYDATIQIPSMFNFVSEGYSSQAPQYECIYTLDESKLTGYSAELSIAKSSAKTEQDQYTKDEAQEELDKYPESKSGEIFGTKRKYVKVSVLTGDNYPDTIFMDIVDLDCDEYTYRVTLSFHKESDAQAPVEKDAYEKLYDEVIKMAKSVKWNK